MRKPDVLKSAPPMFTSSRPANNYLFSRRTLMEVTLCLRYPGSSQALQRLQQSYLECVVEYKSGSDAELQSKLPADLFSKYQLKGAVTVADDEIVIQFTPRHSGVHCARLFADTREVCRPVPFVVTQSGETVSIPPDRPVRRPPSWEPTPAPELMHTPAFYGLNNPRFPPAASPQSVTSDATTAAQTELPRHEPEDHVRGYTSDDLELAVPKQKRLFVSGYSPAQRTAGGTRPHSSMVPDPGRVISPASLQHQSLNFGEIYSTKKARGRAYGTRRGPLSIDYQSMLTTETLRMLSKEADMQMKIFRGGKVKKRCDICSKKVKLTKVVSLGEEEYCDNCFRRQYLIRSAIDHFMVPCVQECSVQVPINRRATKFITARKTIVNVNLRGLEPNDVRNAHEEFNKFDMENNGWIQRGVLMPVLKACLSLSGALDKEAKLLLSSQALQSMVSSYGLDERAEVHEIEFLGLCAFLARERERLRVTANPRAGSIFTRNDLEMAYAYRQQMSGGASKGVGGVIGHHGNQGAGQPGWEGSFPSQQQQGGGGYFLRNSLTQDSFNQQGYSSISPSPSNMANIQTSSPQRRQVGGGYPESMQLFPREQRQSVASSSQYLPLGDRIAARREAAKRLSVVSGGGVAELAEEDQDEDETTLILPPDKDPATQHRTNSLIGKNSPNKQLMEDVNKELKLTGGEADSWMLY